jgi:hypothetical protein
MGVMTKMGNELYIKYDIPRPKEDFFATRIKSEKIAYTATQKHGNPNA